MNKRRKTQISMVLVTLLLATSFSGCQMFSKGETAESQPVIADSGFAAYKDVPVDINPAIQNYKASPGLDNITNRDAFAFSDEAQKFLVQNGFVVIPYPAREFFITYELNRYGDTPNFITTDAMLHNYHLYFSYLLRTLEKDTLRNELEVLTESMLSKSEKQYKSLKNTEWETAAKRNVAFFAVAAKILHPDLDVPSFVSKEVEQELQLIANHQENFYPSPVMNIGNAKVSLVDALKEDYTQYIPRGHYAKSNALKTYFQTMMWYGRMNFRAFNAEETKSAVLITSLFNQEDYDHWNNIYEPTNFFVGKSDDLGINQYSALLQKVYGKNPSVKELTSDSEKWKTLVAQIKKLDPPAINSIPIFNEAIQPDQEKAIKGFRFMGQRFTLDASIFQNLIYRQVKENNQKDFRMLPKGLDMPAAMGSPEAYDILKGMGETAYKNYPENMEKMRKKVKAMDTVSQTRNLYGAWLYTLSPLLEAKGEGYPSFMQNQAWTRKQLETYMGSFTELKHDTVLYVKQSYAEMGGGGEEQDDRGYVEPNAAVYGRIAALTKMTADGLESRKLLKKQTRESLAQLEELALQLKTISEKELAQKPLSTSEYDLIRSFGGQLEHFWLEALQDEGVDGPSAAGANPSALITDIATDPNGRVLEEGTGYVNDIYAVVPVDGTLRIAKGAVYSYYEFAWPSNDRLTDEKWKEMLEDKQNPAAPSWTKMYTAPEGASQW